MGTQTPRTRRLTRAAALIIACYAGGVSGATISYPSSGYAIDRIGLTRGVHTSPTSGFSSSRIEQINNAGMAVGQSQRYGNAGNVNIGQSAWLFDGERTIDLGLRGSQYADANGTRFSEVSFLNDAGNVAGYTARYDGGVSPTWVYNGGTQVEVGLYGENFEFNEVLYFNESGQAAGRNFNSSNRAVWLYNGTNTIRLGLFDDDHTDTDGDQFSGLQGFNESGQAAGNSVRFTPSRSQSSWVYDGTETKIVNLTDDDHTGANGRNRGTLLQFNEAGQAAGYSTYFGSGTEDIGDTAWFYDGNTTVVVGLIDSEHTRSDGYRTSGTQFLTDSGYLSGSSARYGAGGEELGFSAWIYNGVSTRNVGLVDSEHTRDSDGYRSSFIRFLNESGQAAGTASRYGEELFGTTAWLFDGTETKNIGLTGSDFVRIGGPGGYLFSAVTGLNESGQAIGYSDRFSDGTNYIDDFCPCLVSNSRSAWVFDGAQTVEVGLTGSDFVSNLDGARYSEAQFLNEAGQAAGYSLRYGVDGFEIGRSAWFYDGTDVIALDSLSTSSAGDVWSEVGLLTDEGLVLGTYRLYDDADNWVTSVFGYSDEDGLFDLGLEVISGFEDWTTLLSVLGVSGNGDIFGQFNVVDPNGFGAYRLTAVPVPAAVWLFASALGLLGWVRRKAA